MHAQTVTGRFNQIENQKVNQENRVRNFCREHDKTVNDRNLESVDHDAKGCITEKRGNIIEGFAHTAIPNSQDTVQGQPGNGHQD